jgi:hypothetical protein
MPKVSPELRRLVENALERTGWSQREVSRRAVDLSLSTINDMALGVVPGPQKVLAFALATGSDPDEMLEAAGWPFRYRMDVEGGLTNEDTSSKRVRRPGTRGDDDENGAPRHRPMARPLVQTANENYLAGHL